MLCPKQHKASKKTQSFEKKKKKKEQKKKKFQNTNLNVCVCVCIKEVKLTNKLILVTLRNLERQWMG